MLVFDAGRRVLYANDAAIRLGTRLRPDSVWRDSIADWHPELVSPAALARVAADGEWVGEVFLQSDHAPPLVLLLQLVALRSGEALNYGLAARDVSADYALRSELSNRNAELK